MLKISALRKKYPGQSIDALSDIDLDCPAGTFTTLLGPSGCGKSTLLRCVAGLEDAHAGQINLAGRPVFDAGNGLVLPANKRRLGMVFQSYAIWPHMSVGENIGYPLKIAGIRGEERKSQVEDALKRVDLSGFADRPAYNLSGGQQQRVALARAIVRQPDLLLLDEPMSNLDASLRRQLGQQLRDLQKSLGLTVLYVTHDRDEALTMSDNIVVMRGGKIVERNAPVALYERPATRAGALAVGEANFLPAAQHGDQIVNRQFSPPLAVPSLPDGEAKDIMVRPERVLRDQQSGLPQADVRVVASAFRGVATELQVALADGTHLNVFTTDILTPDAGDVLRISVDPKHCRAVGRAPGADQEPHRSVAPVADQEVATASNAPMTNT